MDKLDNIIKKVLQEGDTYEKMAAKGKKAGNLKQGTVRKRLGIPKDEKIPLSKINKEISRLKKMDKDDDKKGVQLGDKNQKYYKALQLSKTLKTTTNMNEEDRATRVDKMLSGEYEDEDYKDSKRYADVRADLEDEMNEEFSSTEQKMINQIKSYKKRGSAMINLPSKVRDFYFKNKEKIDALNENMGEWPKELTSRYSDEYRFELEKVMSDRAKYRVIDIESEELKGTPVFGKPESLMAFADDLIKPQGGTQSTNLGESLEEDMNDPVLVKARAAKMAVEKEKAKQAEMDKKYGSNFMDKLDAEIGLKQELQNLEDEREDVLMRIEDIGVEMEQTAEPEGGPIADELGGRLMTAEKELRAINNKMIDIKDDLGYFRMYESDLDEGNGGAKQDDEINLNVSNANDIADEEEAHSGVLELRDKLKENLVNRLK